MEEYIVAKGVIRCTPNDKAIVPHGKIKPVQLDHGEDLNFTDVDGFEVQVRIVHMVDQLALLEYRIVELQPELLELRVVCLLTDMPLSKYELSSSLGPKRISGQLNKVVRSLLKQERIVRTAPQKPQSRIQKYRLTEKGRAAIKN